MNYISNGMDFGLAFFDVNETSAVTDVDANNTNTSSSNETPVVGFLDWTIILTLINFLILMLILKKFLFKPVEKMIEKRETIIVKDLDDAKNAKEEALSQKKLYDEKILSAKTDAREIISSAQKKADKAADEIITQANEKAALAIDRSEKEIERQKNKAVSEVKQEIGDMATMIAGKIIEKELDEKENEKLIESMLDNIK